MVFEKKTKEQKEQAPPGFEPGAAALQVQRSTTEL